jgi:hypothetical protein
MEPGISKCPDGIGLEIAPFESVYPARDQFEAILKPYRRIVRFCKKHRNVEDRGGKRGNG